MPGQLTLSPSSYLLAYILHTLCKESLWTRPQATRREAWHRRLARGQAAQLEGAEAGSASRRLNGAAVVMLTKLRAVLLVGCVGSPDLPQLRSLPV